MSCMRAGCSPGAHLRVSQPSKLATARELIKRIEKAKADAIPKEALLAGLKEFGESLPAPDRRARYAAAGIQSAALMTLIAETAASLNARSPDEALARLRKTERALAAAKL